MKELLGTVKADETELSVYRARLAARLDQESPAASPPSFWSIWRLAASGAAAVAHLAVTLIGLRPPGSPAFTQTDLSEVEALAASSNPRIIDGARVALTNGDDLARWNARMVLCLTNSSDCVELAADGVQEDPRADFRFLYLEVLLDRADERRFDTARMEELMDRETDLGCLRLYDRLFRIVA